VVVSIGLLQHSLDALAMLQEERNLLIPQGDAVQRFFCPEESHPWAESPDSSGTQSSDSSVLKNRILGRRLLPPKDYLTLLLNCGKGIATLVLDGAMMALP
jgi:hypothetical protein